MAYSTRRAKIDSRSARKYIDARFGGTYRRNSIGEILIGAIVVINYENANSAESLITIQ